MKRSKFKRRAAKKSIARRTLRRTGVRRGKSKIKITKTFKKKVAKVIESQAERKKGYLPYLDTSLSIASSPYNNPTNVDNCIGELWPIVNTNMLFSVPLVGGPTNLYYPSVCQIIGIDTTGNPWPIVAQGIGSFNRVGKQIRVHTYKFVAEAIPLQAIKVEEPASGSIPNILTTNIPGYSLDPMLQGFWNNTILPTQLGGNMNPWQLILDGSLPTSNIRVQGWNLNECAFLTFMPTQGNCGEQGNLFLSNLNAFLTALGSAQGPHDFLNNMSDYNLAQKYQIKVVKKRFFKIGMDNGVLVMNPINLVDRASQTLDQAPSWVPVPSDKPRIQKYKYTKFSALGEKWKYEEDDDDYPSNISLRHVFINNSMATFTIRYRHFISFSDV